MEAENLKTPEETAAGRARRESHALYRDWMLLLTISVVLAADQLSKYIVRTNMLLGESWPDEGFFRFTHGTNTGTAFGLFPSQTFVLIIASVVAIGFLYYFYRTHALPIRPLRFAIGLQLGGALGNLIDRLRVGAVVDFIDVGSWPIFNLADSSIVVGMVLLIAVLVSAPGDKGQASETQARDDGDGAGP